ncbi:MAG TPA: rhomboid family intramembrane serine protease [Cyclobacteriaceae bacterium]|nr:rhomboid family intramembrane serine protease [Cyclobacteriaceae bacterium]
MTVTVFLILITVLVSFPAFTRPALQQRLMMTPYLIDKDREYYRFLSSGFIHRDHMHLLLNMFSFYFLGSVVERVFGILFGGAGLIYYGALYLSAIVVSDLPTYFKQKDNPHYHSLGASGGVAAVIFAFIILEPMQYICVYIALCMPGFILGGLYIAYSYFQGRKSNDSINHDAHLYGSLYGLVFCMILYPDSIPGFYHQVKDWIVGLL